MATLVKPYLETFERDGNCVFRWNLHRGQREVLAARERYILALAGNQSGKTVIGPPWLLLQMKEFGPGEYIAASANYDLLRMKMLPELRKVFGRMPGWAYNKSERVWSDGDYSILIRSGEAPGGLESCTAKAAWLDEWGQPQIDITTWEAVQRRLGVHQGRALFTTTPYALNWLKTAVYDRAKGGDPLYRLISFRSLDNPSFPREEWDRAEREMPDWRFRMMYCGEFTKPAGVIYLDFNESQHVVEPFSIPHDWLVYVGVDFGLVHTAIVWFAVDPQSGMVYAYREYLGGGMTGTEHARRCLEYNEPVVCWTGGAPSEDAQRLEWADGGVQIARPPISDLEAGISHVVGLIRTDRLRIFENLYGLRSELTSYSRELDAAGEPTARIANKETFHRLDAVRYGLSVIPVGFTAPKQPPEDLWGRRVPHPHQPDTSELTFAQDDYQ